MGRQILLKADKYTSCIFVERLSFYMAICAIIKRKVLILPFMYLLLVSFPNNCFGQKKSPDIIRHMTHMFRHPCLKRVFRGGLTISRTTSGPYVIWMIVRIFDAIVLMRVQNHESVIIKLKVSLILVIDFRLHLSLFHRVWVVLGKTLNSLKKNTNNW